MSDPFADLLDRNRRYATEFAHAGTPGRADMGVAMVTCMDSRIDPLAILGFSVGDAKVVRNPGGRVTDEALEALVLATNLLGADRLLVVEHTRCAVASNSESQIQEAVSQAAGTDASGYRFHVIEDQRRALAEDVERVRRHPLIGDRAEVGGFLYDVDTGLLERVA